MSSSITSRSALGAKQPFVTLNPAPVIARRAPTIFDNYEASTIWIQQFDTSGNKVNSIWILSSVQNGSANWIKVTPDGGDANFNNLFLPNTDTLQTQGIIYFGNDPWIIRYGNNNAFFGLDAGNTTLDFLAGSTQNTGIGVGSLNHLTLGFLNTAIGLDSGNLITEGYQNNLFGAGCGFNITTGFSNTGIGHDSLSSLITGNSVIALGVLAASNYIGAESNNICIGNKGLLGESNTIHIGDSDVHDQTFIAGQVISSSSIFSSGDTSGVSGQVGFTNVIDTSQSSGNMNIKSTTTNTGINTGYIKFYVNGVIAYVPYFTNIAP